MYCQSDVVALVYKEIKDEPIISGLLETALEEWQKTLPLERIVSQVHLGVNRFLFYYKFKENLEINMIYNNT